MKHPRELHEAPFRGASLGNSCQDASKGPLWGVSLVNSRGAL